MVWLSGLSASLQTKGLLVRFPVRAHTWVVSQVPSWEPLIQRSILGIIGKYSFHYGRFPFHVADVFFSRAEAFYFNEVPFDIFVPQQ